MRHLSLEAYNAMKSGHLQGPEREQAVDHVLECDTCATRFRMLNELDSHMTERKKSVLPYGLAMAAILVMALYPFQKAEQVHLQTIQVAQAEAPSLHILEQVKQVNTSAAFASWNQGVPVTELVSNLK